MGYMKHHSIIVTSWNVKRLKEAHEKAIEIFSSLKTTFGNGYDSLISPIISGIANSQDSFFIAPDGSKEGWEPSDDCNIARKEFLDWIVGSGNLCDYVEVEFGGDSDYNDVIRSKHRDLDKEEYY